MDYETTEVSKCCSAHFVEHQDDNGKDFQVCVACKRTCEIAEVCVHCLGTGEMTVDEAVYAGEPHMAPIGTQKCICQLGDQDDYDDQE